MNKSLELKPCRCSNENVKYVLITFYSGEDDHYGGRYHEIYCSECDTSEMEPEYDDDKVPDAFRCAQEGLDRDAIEKEQRSKAKERLFARWNNRTTEDGLKKRIKELEKGLEIVCDSAPDSRFVQTARKLLLEEK